MTALRSHAAGLVDLVPQDIVAWCPAYPQAEAPARRAFWVGFASALAKFESTYRATAVGGGGRWFGLLQITPATARGYGCEARSGGALKDGAANVRCALRIMAHTVARDGVLHGYRGGKGQGVTADWGPMHSAKKRADMAGWLRKQSYCTPLSQNRPRGKPAARGAGE